MNPETTKLINKAVRQIQIRDVVLGSSKFDQFNPLPKSKRVEVVQQSREGWGHEIQRGKQPEAKAEWVLIQYFFGVRLIRNGAEDPVEPEAMYYLIEAEFVGHYKVVSDQINDKAIAAFAEHNAKHNIWPFWRQHVFDVCQRARISPPEIGLYPGNSE